MTDNKRNFIQRECFEHILSACVTANGKTYKDIETIYGDMSRLVVAWLASQTPKQINMLYNQLGWRGEANGRALHESAKHWMSIYRGSKPTLHHPPRHIGLVACVGSKHLGEHRAKDLYDSALFSKTRSYVEKNCDQWFILSAKHGLLAPEERIASYNSTLNDQSKTQRNLWAQSVWNELASKINAHDTVTILAGEKYREFLIPYLHKLGCTVNIPMKGLGIGSQLQWLDRQISDSSISQDIHRFYRLLKKLEEKTNGKRLMRKCHGKQHWPEAGIYFFFEPGEFRRDTMESRVVRIGTHRVSSGSKTTLWQRLITHRGPKHLHGNHRGSIFRHHVGNALAKRNPVLFQPTWQDMSLKYASMHEQEKDLEVAVSKHIGTMPLLWLEVNDKASVQSDRAYLEQNLIGLVSNYNRLHAQPSDTWLGHDSTEQSIRDSGLWNVNHIGYNYDPLCLDRLENYIQKC